MLQLGNICELLGHVGDVGSGIAILEARLSAGTPYASSSRAHPSRLSLLF